MSEMSTDPLWSAVFLEASAAAETEPLLVSFLHRTVLRHHSLEEGLAFHLSSKLASPVMDARALMALFCEVYAADVAIGISMRSDIEACYQRDPACRGYAIPFLYFKGFHAIQCQRITHWLWSRGRQSLALFLQNRISEITGADIHPAAQLGDGLLLDHGTGVVIGETAVIGNNVSILHGVTLGGSGKERDDRHPKIGDGVLLGAGSAVLGNILIGECVKVGAGSVVLDDVPAHCTVAGVPARVVSQSMVGTPALDMDQWV